MSGDGDLVTGRMLIWSIAIAVAVVFSSIIVGKTVSYYQLPLAERLEIEEQREVAREAEAEERAAKRAERAAEKAERERQKASRQLARRHRGFHCLSAWNGSNRATIIVVKETALDPDSFQHVRTTILPNDRGWHQLHMIYRANNAFGALIVAAVRSDVHHETCRAVNVRDAPVRPAFPRPAQEDLEFNLAPS